MYTLHRSSTVQKQGVINVCASTTTRLGNGLSPNEQNKLRHDEEKRMNHEMIRVPFMTLRNLMLPTNDIFNHVDLDTALPEIFPPNASRKALAFLKKNGVPTDDVVESMKMLSETKYCGQRSYQEATDLCLAMFYVAGTVLITINLDGNGRDSDDIERETWDTTLPNPVPPPTTLACYESAQQQEFSEFGETTFDARWYQAYASLKNTTTDGRKWHSFRTAVSSLKSRRERLFDHRGADTDGTEQQILKEEKDKFKTAQFNERRITKVGILLQLFSQRQSGQNKVGPAGCKFV